MLQPINSAQIRISNMRTLLTVIRDYGPISKRELQQRTGLSWGSVSSLTTLLLHSHHIVATSKQSTAPGRRPEELDINTSENLVIGLDLNVTGLCGIITDMKGRIVQEWMRAFPQLTYDCILNTIFTLLDDILNSYKDCNILGIGMAVQGIVNSQEGISVWIPAVENWKSVPLQKLIVDRYGISTKLWHDPNCIMIAERVFGLPAMRDSQNALLIRMDQGIGMSIMSNGQLHLGASEEAGELVHMMVDPNGLYCPYCGNYGCLGTYAAGAGMTTRFIEEVKHNRSSKLMTDNEQALTYHDIAAAAFQGDELSLELFRDMGAKTGQALSTLYLLFNPELIVMYGDMCQHRELFFVSLQEHLHQHLYGNYSPKLSFSKLGRNAAALGATLLISDEIIATMDFKECDMLTTL